MYRIETTAIYRKQRKILARRGYDLGELETVVEILATGGTLPEKYRDHALSGNRRGQRDCHIRPDWLLLYKIEKEIVTLILCETGSHSDLFE